MSDEPLTREDLDGMNSDQIVEAGAAGRLDDLFDRRRRESEQVSREDVKTMAPDAIRDALKSGRLNDVLRGAA